MKTQPTAAGTTAGNEAHEQEGYVLLSFRAAWCGSCHIMEPVIRDVQQQFNTELKIISLDYDQSPEAIRRYHIRETPTMILLKNGKEKDRIAGTIPRITLKERLQQHLDQ